MRTHAELVGQLAAEHVAGAGPLAGVLVPHPRLRRGPPGGRRAPRGMPPPAPRAPAPHARPLIPGPRPAAATAAGTTAGPRTRRCSGGARCTPPRQRCHTAAAPAEMCAQETALASFRSLLRPVAATAGSARPPMPWLVSPGGGRGGGGGGPRLQLAIHLGEAILDVHLDARLRHLAVRLGHQLDQSVQRHLQPRDLLRAAAAPAMSTSLLHIPAAGGAALAAQRGSASPPDSPPCSDLHRPPSLPARASMQSCMLGGGGGGGGAHRQGHAEEVAVQAAQDGLVGHHAHNTPARARSR